MPPFDKSAMDGFAISSKDRSEKFSIVKVIPAGAVPKMKIKRGECAKIMTGAMLPDGTDRVVKKEVTEEKNGVMFIRGEDKAFNVCLKGEDIQVGDRILASGDKIRSAEVGIIASMGMNAVKVYKKPLVGILTTGSEIVEPGKKLSTGQIYNSNSYSLSAQILELGAEVRYGGIVSDNQKLIGKNIERFLSTVDMVLISGGVSMGDFDYVPQILENLGVTLHFEKVAIKPGKPTVFGTLGEKIVFGLPGNPVSTFIIFEIFVKPLLYRLLGYTFTPFYLKGVMQQDMRRKKSIRLAFVPVMYDKGKIFNISYHGSAHFNVLSQANALLEIPAGINEILRGSEVDVRQI
jgi:molybdopterin molybdotransferase